MFRLLNTSLAPLRRDLVAGNGARPR